MNLWLSKVIMLYYFALRQKIMLTEFLNRPLFEPQQRHLDPQGC